MTGRGQFWLRAGMFLLVTWCATVWLVLAPAVNASITGDCRTALLKAGVKYCKRARRGLVRCMRSNLNRELAIDCIADEARKGQDRRSELRARRKIRAGCLFADAGNLGFPNLLCPAATDLQGVEACFWETPVQWVDGSLVDGQLRYLCLAAASRLDPRGEQPGGYPEPVATVAQCRQTFLKAGLKFVEISTKALARCERKNIIGPPRFDCVSDTGVLLRELGNEQRVRDKIAKECVATAPAQLGYPTADCNDNGSAPPSIAAVEACLWENQVDGLAGALRRDRFAVVDALVPPVCGNGVWEPFSFAGQGEQCDDGNVQSGTCCSATCQLVPAGSICDDLDPCTSGDQCDGAGNCVGTSNTCGNNL